MVEGAVLFLIAASGRAPRLFAAVRQDGAFSSIPSERIVRSILIVIAFFVLLGVYLLRTFGPAT
jgi:flagellar biogenesis protein FliO